MRLIDADKFLAQIEDQYMEHDLTRGQYLDLEDRILQQPTVEPEGKKEQWIPFRTRPLTAEEKEDYPDYDFFLDCELPDNGQRVLVNIQCNGHESVQADEYYDDEGCYLESGYDIGTEANAWMPLPEPWEGGE